MAVTIKQIAEISGVSRGTVDRVLNGRGHVTPEKEAFIRQVAQQLGYKPNLAGKALAARKKSFMIGVLLTSEGIPFFNEVIRGIHVAAEKLQEYGIQLTMHTIKGYHPHIQVQELDELAQTANAIILNPIDDPVVCQKINELADSGICVITVNTDIEHSRRLCYVGCNYRKGGEIACGIMGLLTNGHANIAILTGSRKVLGHRQRIEGFQAVMREKYPDFHIIAMDETNDDDIVAFEVTQRILTNHPEINSIFLVAAGHYGVHRALLSLGLEHRVCVIPFDHTPETQEMMRRGTIRATICQQPFVQGFEAMQIAFRYLVNGEVPENGQYIVKNEIKILENLEEESCP